MNVCPPKHALCPSTQAGTLEKWGGTVKKFFRRFAPDLCPPLSNSFRRHCIRSKTLLIPQTLRTRAELVASCHRQSRCILYLYHRTNVPHQAEQSQAACNFSHEINRLQLTTYNTVWSEFARIHSQTHSRQCCNLLCMQCLPKSLIKEVKNRLFSTSLSLMLTVNSV